MHRSHSTPTKRRGRRAVYAALGVCFALLLGCAVLTGSQVGTDVPVEEIEYEVPPTPQQLSVTPEPVPDTPEPSFAPTPTPSPTPTPTRHPLNGDALLSGDHAPIVIDIQIRLMELDYLDFEQPDDEYSDGTADAIRAFQVRNGLHANGICNAETFEKLFSEDALTYAMVRGSTGDDVLLAKERLIELGYLEGTPFGEYDEETEAAVRRFRQKNGLLADVIIDSAAFEKLLGENTVSNFYGLGDKDEVIETYQQILFELGYLTYPPDGVFGKQTQNAVRRFQEENGLIVDGCLAKSTVDLLKSGTCDPFVFTVGTEGTDVQHIQERLAYYGYLGKSQVTGYYGDKTQAAVKSFQSRNGIKADGAVGYKTIQVLLRDDAKKAPATPKPATPKPTKKPSTSSKPTATPKPGTTPKPTATPKPDDGDTGSGSTINYGQGIEAFIRIAESKLGCRYVRGAKGPNSFDCSGFVYWCLNQAGVKQSYMTSIAWRSCTKYRRIRSMSEIKRGDVLVFKGKSMSTGHVGIYLGNGRMIDASSSKGKVRITESVLSGSYWKDHFLMAYRIWD